MENWIIRSVALLCAIGGLGLAWAFGAFTAIPVRDGRIFAMDGQEMQLVGISLLACLAVAWGALHLAGLADKEVRPRSYRLVCAVYGVALVAAAGGGANWSMARVLVLAPA